MLVSLNKFSGQVGLVKDDGVENVKLDGLELCFGEAEIFMVLLDNGFELWVSLWVGKRCFGLCAE